MSPWLPPPIHCYVTANVFSGQERVAKRPQLDGLIMGGSHAGASVAGGSKDPAPDTVCYARLQHSRPPPAAPQAAAAAASLRMPGPATAWTPPITLFPLLILSPRRRAAVPPL
ncbi:hypothetical protein E2C01_095567 [Portunus trituberculatus]|uniref:Uncharacterized protein n=1 Tax=Portunus trituberculatus TaxID=210409 RepID=A0A5B7K0N6_PORTR|nr:hypothetical protein [Portunus trituberculatus]